MFGTACRMQSGAVCVVRCWYIRSARSSTPGASGSRRCRAGSAPSSSPRRSSSSSSRSRNRTLEPATTVRCGRRWPARATATRPSGSARPTSPSSRPTSAQISVKRGLQETNHGVVFILCRIVHSPDVTFHRQFCIYIHIHIYTIHVSPS